MRKDRAMKYSVLSLVVVIMVSGCSKPSAEEMFNKGVEAQKADQYDAAIELYMDLIETYPDSMRTPEAFYAVASIYQNQKKSYHQAIALYRQIAEKYPTHATATSALFLVGFIYNNELKNYDSARIAYEEFIHRYPSHQLVASAQFELQTLGKDPGQILELKTPIAETKTTSGKSTKKK